MPRICLFPGTFDPLTLGHVDIIDRAMALFDRLVIGIGVNASKQPMFSLEDRLKWCRELYKNDPEITVEAYEGLTVDFCREIGAGFILRGIRFAGEFEYERSIAAMNRRLDTGIETFFLASSPRFSTLASTLVRDVIRHGGDVSPFLPHLLAERLKK